MISRRDENKSRILSRPAMVYSESIPRRSCLTADVSRTTLAGKGLVRLPYAAVKCPHHGCD